MRSGDLWRTELVSGGGAEVAADTATRLPDEKFDNWFGEANGAEHAEQRDQCSKDGLLIPVGESAHFELAQFLHPALEVKPDEEP